MHIGFLIYGDITTISGGYLYDRKIIEYFRKQGDTVSVISLKRHHYFQDVLINQPVSAFNVQDLDIIIEDELVHPSMLWTNSKLKNQIPIIALVHLFHSFSIQPKYINWLYRRIEKKYLSTVDGLVLNSKNTFSQAKQLMGGRLVNNIIALPSGDNFVSSNNHEQNQQYTGAQPLNILYIGNVIQQKGLHILLTALSKLKSNSFKLTVTGRSDMEPGFVNKTMHMISKCRLSSQVEFTGPLPPDELPALYKRHDLMVLPSQNEAFGIVYLEAMQFGLPVIGTTSGGANEIINHGVNGYLIQPGDSNQLSEYLHHLINTPDALLTMGENALKRYQQHPKWDETGQLIREFLLSYLNKG